MKFLGIPADSIINQGAHTLTRKYDGYAPFEFTGCRNESMAARETAWIGVSLMGSPTFDIWGPDAVKFLNYYCVNRDWSDVKAGRIPPCDHVQ